MKRYKLGLALVVIGLLSLSMVSLTNNSPARAVTTTACQYFSETNYQVCGRFLEYWSANGGLAQQGYPISNEFNELNAPPPAGDGKIHKVQYFQRARFEEHLENSQPYDVLLGLLGAEQVRAKYNGNPPGGNLYQPPTATPVPSAFVSFVTVQGAGPGGSAYVAVKTVAGANCAIRYTTPAGTVSTAQGLISKTADSGGNVGWTWVIGTSTRPGTGLVEVICEGAYASTGITIG